VRRVDALLFCLRFRLGFGLRLRNWLVIFEPVEEHVRVLADNLIICSEWAFHSGVTYVVPFVINGV